MSGHTRRPGSAVLLFCLAILVGRPAPAWGPEGHQVVARIAAGHLNSHARTEVAAILGVSISSAADEMARVSTWADEIRSAHKETASWHFVNIPRDQPNGKPSRFCPKGNCVTFRIEDFRRRLASGQPGPNMSSGPAEWTRSDQLKFLIHFVGDVHQPLHAVDNSDHGGNCIAVTSLRSGNLHRAWDTTILERTDPDGIALARLLSAEYDALASSEKSALGSGTPDEWASEAHRLALRVAYRHTKPSIPLVRPEVEPIDCAHAPAAIRALRVRLSHRYIESARSVIEEQLLKAGVRLAAILNSIWP
jgi:hypothetical protein